MKYQWEYLLLGVAPIRKRLIWAWLERVRGAELAEVLQRWKSQGVGLKRIYRPPYSPEVNPVERAKREIVAKMRESTTLPLYRDAHGHSRTLIEGILQQLQRGFGGMWRGGYMGA